MTDSQVSVLAAGGLSNAGLIVEAADRTGVPLAIAAAMVEKESGGRNVYGHDTGGVFSVPGRDIEVTQENYGEFLRRVLAGEKSNGVGPAQITYRGYFERYPEYPFGEPLANIRFGLTILADYLRGDYSDASVAAAGARYNGGTNPGPRALAYGADLLTKTKAWRVRLAATTEGKPVNYTFHTQYDSPNFNPGTIKLPASRCVLHWWGNPSGQDPWGIVRWLSTPSAQVSAHAVVWPGNVACIVPYTGRSWANGNDEANRTAITLECDPNDIPGTIPTVVAYLADLVRQNVLTPDFVLSGHRDWYATACPGDYYPLLGSIRQQVRDTLAGNPTNQEDDMTPDQASMLTEVHEALRRGQAGSHPAGHIPGQLTSFENLFRPAEAGRLSEDGDILARLKRIEARLDAAKPPAVELDGTLADLSAVVETAVRRVLDDASATIRFSAPATEK